MNINLLKEVKEILGNGRRLHHYHKDQYAVWLLAKLIQKRQGITVSKLKSTSFAKLLERPVVKHNLMTTGKGIIKTGWWDNIVADTYESIVITLSEWGNEKNYGWSQTSRPGSNLVLQFNFTNEHDQCLKRLKLDRDAFKCYAHPINFVRNSFAWSRIDFDFETGEVLIEEIQNDWVRLCNKHHKLATHYRHQGYRYYSNDGINFCVTDMLSYTGQILQQYNKLWSEVVMSLTLKFIVEELGINKVYYHESSTGSKLKRIKSRLPPKSLYSTLPKKFCFQLGDEVPEFLIKERRIKKNLNKIKQPKFYLLTI